MSTEDTLLATIALLILENDELRKVTGHASAMPGRRKFQRIELANAKLELRPRANWSDDGRFIVEVEG
jgi:hypothetical protein